MTKNDIKQETRRRLAEVSADLASDEQEVERQVPDVHRRMIEEADKAKDHYTRVAREAMTPNYRKLYEEEAAKQEARGEALRAILSS